MREYDHPWEFYTEHFKRIVCSLLEVTDTDQIHFDYTTLGLEEEEPYILPSGTEVLFKMENVRAPKCHYGDLSLCKKGNVLFVAEINASPYLFYIKK